MDSSLVHLLHLFYFTAFAIQQHCQTIWTNSAAVIPSWVKYLTLISNFYTMNTIPKSSWMFTGILPDLICIIRYFIIDFIRRPLLFINIFLKINKVGHYEEVTQYACLHGTKWFTSAVFKFDVFSWWNKPSPDGPGAIQNSFYNAYHHGHFLIWMGLTFPDGMLVLEGPTPGFMTDPMFWRNSQLRRRSGDETSSSSRTSSL